MTNAFERLLSLKVADVASPEVVQISSHDAMTRAAKTLLDHSISGAPVVDEHGWIVGVLTAFDFVRRACCCDSPGIAPAGSNALSVDDADRPLCVEDLPHDMVSRFMSSGVQTIAAEAGLLEAARIMCATHVHRLPVMDEQHRPCGVVTSLDIVAALVNTVEEQQGTQQPKPGVHSTGR